MAASKVRIHRSTLKAHVGEVEVEQRKVAEVGPSQVRPDKDKAPPGTPQRHAGRAHMVQGGAFEQSVVEHGTMQVCARKHRAIQRGAVEAGSACVHSVQTGARQAGAGPIRSHEAGLRGTDPCSVHITADAAVELRSVRPSVTQRGPDEEGVPEVRAQEHGAIEPGPGEVCAGQAATRQIDPAKIATGQIPPAQVHRPKINFAEVGSPETRDEAGHAQDATA